MSRPEEDSVETARADESGAGRPLTELRDAERSDVARIAEIYNQAVLRTVATFDTEEKSLDSMMEWFAHHGGRRHSGRYPAVVAVVRSEVIGWGSLSAWSDRCAYEGTCEASIYVDEARRGAGVGGLLLDELIRRAQSSGMHTILSRIAGGNEASVLMHLNRGFVHIGTMREVGLKFGRLLDVDMYQIILSSKAE